MTNVREPYFDDEDDDDHADFMYNHYPRGPLYAWMDSSPQLLINRLVVPTCIKDHDKYGTVCPEAYFLHEKYKTIEQFNEECGTTFITIPFEWKGGKFVTGTLLLDETFVFIDIDAEWIKSNHNVLIKMENEDE